MKFIRAARSWLSAGAVSALLIIAAGFLLPGGAGLRVVSLKGGQTLWAGVFDTGERFTLHYYHSVENAPIWEEHSLDDNGNIFIEEERYLKFGAGMGRMPGVGRLVMKGPDEAIVDMHMPVGDFVLRVGSLGVNHTIIWRGTRVNLSAMVPHQAVQFIGRPLNLWQRLYLEVFPDPATPRAGKG